MKLNCGPDKWERWEAHKAAMAEWHPYFVIWPRRVGPRDCRWLETIERRGKPRMTWEVGSRFYWEYRAP